MAKKVSCLVREPNKTPARSACFKCASQAVLPRPNAPTLAKTKPTIKINLLRAGCVQPTNMDTKILKNSYKLNVICGFEQNWDGYGADAFSRGHIVFCKTILRTLTIQPDVFPTGRRSIQFEYEKPDGDYLEFEIFENDEASANKFTCKMFRMTSDGSETTKWISCDKIGEYVDRFHK